MPDNRSRALPQPVREKLGKLVLMLSTNHDGERIGAVTAIDGLLRKAGCDWHDLAGMIVAPSPAAATPPPPPSQTDSEHVPADELIALVETLRARRRFDRNSEEFLDSLLDRADRYNVVFLSPKMWNWLQDLVVRAGL